MTIQRSEVFSFFHSCRMGTAALLFSAVLVLSGCSSENAVNETTQSISAESASSLSGSTVPEEGKDTDADAYEITGSEEEASPGLAYGEISWTTEDLAQIGEEIPDAGFVPDYFSFSGGTGRASVDCLYLAEEGNLGEFLPVSDSFSAREDADPSRLWGMLRFDSSHYQYYTVDGLTYDTAHGEDSSYALVPVTVCRNFDLTGMTTAMSAGHEITYTLYIGSSEDGSDAAAATDAGASYSSLDDEAPSFAGLSFTEELPADSDFLRIFSYSGGVYLIELDIGTDGKFDDPAFEPETEPNLYLNPVIKYLVVPEDMELPAGTEKITVIVRYPAAGICTASENAAEMLEETGNTDRIAMASEPGEEISYRDLIASSADLVLADEKVLPSGPEDAEAYLELTDSMMTLQVPMLIDRSAEDTADGAKEAWLQVYNIFLA